MSRAGPILRIFEVRTKAGCCDQLLANFATTSADVVRDKPGNQGYFFGKCIQGGENEVMFVSVWQSLDAIKSRFGDDWQKSYMPEGYEDLIEEHSIKHVETGEGWHVGDL
ncbi:MAG: antibiotic biosynthesis monooxygenase [Pseudomonadota bacterium]